MSFSFTSQSPQRQERPRVYTAAVPTAVASVTMAHGTQCIITERCVSSSATPRACEEAPEATSQAAE